MKWLIDLGFEKYFHGKNKRLFSLKKLLIGSFETVIDQGFIKIRGRSAAQAWVWILVAKHLNQRQIVYSIQMNDGQGRETGSDELNKEDFTKKLEDLLKRLKVNEI